MTNLLDDKATDKLVQNISGSFAVLCDEISNKVAKHLDRISASWVQAANVYGKVNKGPDPFEDNAILSAVLDSLGKQAGLHGLTATEDIEKAVLLEFEKLRHQVADAVVALDYIFRNFEHETDVQVYCKPTDDHHVPADCRKCIAGTAQEEMRQQQT